MTFTSLILRHQRLLTIGLSILSILVLASLKLWRFLSIFSCLSFIFLTLSTPSVLVSIILILSLHH